MVKSNSKTTVDMPYDAVVIGGGAAGMMAAIAAAEAGANVLVLEKNTVLGKKLRITGGGRCNITNATPVVRTLLSAYKEAGKFLFSPFSQFGVEDTLTWFADIGVPTVEEAERRVFPTSQSAVQVTEALITKMKQVGVTVRSKSAVQSLTKVGNNFRIQLIDKTVIECPRVIVATGGLSRPETGSTGDALPWLLALGHTIKPPRSALVPLQVAEVPTVARLSGVSLLEAGIKIYDEGTVISRTKGKVLFTHDGLSGPGILNQSATVGGLLAEGQETVRLELDLMPAVPLHTLEEQFLARLMASPNKLLRNQFADMIPGALVAPVLQVATVEAATPSHGVTVEMRRAILHTLKSFPFTVTKLHGNDRAVVTAGGVALPEIDFKTMESRLIAGLYVVGDMLDINRPSGGYNLQISWTTGVVAGRNAGARGETQPES